MGLDVRVGEAMGHAVRELVAGAAFDDARADRIGEDKLAAQAVTLAGADPRSAQTTATRSPTISQLFIAGCQFVAHEGDPGE